MASKSTKPVQSTALATINEKLKAFASDAAKTEDGTGLGVQSFSLLAGVLSFDGDALPGNRVALVVLDHVLLNTFYGQTRKKFDPKNPEPPTCFAIGRDADTLAPHSSVVAAGQAQNDICRTCPWNAFGSSDTGRGKACQQRRRLVVIPAGDLDQNGGFTSHLAAPYIAAAEPAYLTLPVTSTIGWAQYVRLLETTLHRPPFAVVTLVELKPDVKTQFKLHFSTLEAVESVESLEALIERHEASKSLAEQPLSLERRDASLSEAGQKAAPRKAGKRTKHGF